MAIDGVKIIDSDGGYDIYNTMENIYEEITADKKVRYSYNKNIEE